MKLKAVSSRTLQEEQMDRLKSRLRGSEGIAAYIRKLVNEDKAKIGKGE